VFQWAFFMVVDYLTHISQNNLHHYHHAKTVSPANHT